MHAGGVLQNAEKGIDALLRGEQESEGAKWAHSVGCVRIARLAVFRANVEQILSSADATTRLQGAAFTS